MKLKDKTIDVIQKALGFDGYATDEFIAAALKHNQLGDRDVFETRKLCDSLGFKRTGRFVYQPNEVK